jgi:hypothetical protein
VFAFVFLRGGDDTSGQTAGAAKNNKVVDSSSKAVPVTGGKFCTRRKKLVGVGFLIFLNLVLIVFGGVFPTLVKNLQDAAVKELVAVNPQKLSAEKLAKWNDDYLNSNYAIWNITNLYDVLTLGAKINVEQVGPVKAKSWSTQFDVVTSDDLSEIAYYSVDSEEIDYSDATTAAIINAPLVVINPIYLKVMGVAARLSTPLSPPVVDPDMRELYIQAGIGATVVFNNVAAQFLDTSLSLHAGFRLNSFLAYIKYVVPWVTGNQGRNPSDPLETLATVSNFLNATSQAVAPSFNLPAPFADAHITIVKTQLFNPANSYSLANAAGLAFWGKMLLAVKAAGANQAAQVAAAGPFLGTLITNIFAYDQSTATADIFNVALWLGALIADPSDSSASVSQQAISADYVLYCTKGLNSADPTISTFGIDLTGSLTAEQQWQSLAALQWGTGKISQIIANDASATSLIDTPLGAQGASISASFPYSPAKPLEFARGISYAENPLLLAIIRTNSTFYGDFPYTDTQGLYLNVSQSLTILNNFYEKNPGVTAAVMSAGMGFLIGQLRAVWETYVGMVAAHQDPAAAVGAALASVQAAHSSVVAAFGIDIHNVLPIYIYFAHYIGQLFTGNMQHINALGCTPENNGLFICMTVKQYLYGNFTTPFVDFPGVLGLPLRNEGKSIDEIKADYMAEHNVGDRKFVHTTGRDDISKVGRIVSYEGVAASTTECSLADPYGQKECNMTANPTNYFSNYTLWGSGHQEVIKGTWAITQTKPFQDDIETDLNAYISQINRVLPTVYTGEVDLAGIPLRRYQVDPRVLFLDGGGQGLDEANNPYKNDRIYKTGTKYGNYDGLALALNLFGGVGVTIGVPHMSHVPDYIRSTFSSSTLHPDPERWSTSIDVEPYTGLTFRAYKRLEISFRLRDTEWKLPNTPFYTNNMYQKVWNHAFIDNSTESDGTFLTSWKSVIVPQVYIEQYKEAGDDDISSFKKNIIDLRKMAKDLQVALCTVGAVGFIGSIAGFVLIKAAVVVPK